MAEIDINKLFKNDLYREDIENTAKLPLPWERLKDRDVVISGGSGLIGSFLIDVLMWRNRYFDQKCRITAIGRNGTYLKNRFGIYSVDQDLDIMVHDVNDPITDFKSSGKKTVVLHLASNTHPRDYASDPIGTITTNILGLKNMLDFSMENGTERFVFASSNEIYGENRGDTELFSETYCGYIDCNTLRAGYPESKRCGEALCQAYLEQKKLDIVIPRFTRSFGPTMLLSDSKAISQFIKKGLAGENIVLKSEGNQFYSFTYVSDAVSGLLTVLLAGKTGCAYNIADVSSDVTLKELAVLIAKEAGTEVVFEIPDDTEKKGYSTATKARLNGEALKKLGWKLRYDISSGVGRTMDILRSCSEFSNVG